MLACSGGNRTVFWVSGYSVQCSEAGGCL